MSVPYRRGCQVLFHGLKHEREDFISQIDGMFAFCFLVNEYEIILARDKYGQKPLYYHCDSFKNISFGSELEA